MHRNHISTEQNACINEKYENAIARIADRTASQHLRGHVTSSVTWPFDTPYVISYWWSFGTESLSPAVFEILRSKRIVVSSLTFHISTEQLNTWPFDSPYTISYWWSFGTKPLSLTVSEIFNVKCNAMVAVTLIRPLNKGEGQLYFGTVHFSYTTSYRLWIVTFALARTV